ncbi:MAG: hypothetical protein DRJ42_23685 [Deltaproteobacteria bacterium]|nr:MAG: hypothetical protein DRJ42_23685 [Deltaproteobacteria bacterium]
MRRTHAAAEAYTSMRYALFMSLCLPRPALSFSLCLLVSLAASGCSDPATPGGSCATSSDCDSPDLCLDGLCVTPITADSGNGDTGTRSTDSGIDSAVSDTGADASCGNEAIPFDYRPPNVLFVFDRSCSMRRRLDDSTLFGTGPDDPRTRWYVAREAALSLIADYESRVFWGLMAFPDPREGCGMPATAEVVPGPGNRMAIEAELVRNRIQPFGLCGPDNTDTTTQPRQTPTFEALEGASTLPEMMDTMRDSFVVLLTDGGASCTDADALGTLTATLGSMGIPVAVVGFSTSDGETTLEAIATNGGLPRPGGMPSYYTAESRADLDSIFSEIATRVVSCELSLTTTPPNPDEIFVSVDDVDLAESATDGWSYDAAANSITFNGTPCDRLRSGDITRIGISFGCAPSACIPQPEVCNGLDDDCDDMVDEDCLL